MAFKNGGNFCEDQDDRLRSIMKMVGHGRGRWRKKSVEHTGTLPLRNATL